MKFSVIFLERISTSSLYGKKGEFQTELIGDVRSVASGAPSVERTKTSPSEMSPCQDV